LLVEEDEPPEEVPDPELEPVPDLASAVVLQVKVPWMLPLEASDLKPEQSIWAVDCMLKPPLTSLSFGN